MEVQFNSLTSMWKEIYKQRYNRKRWSVLDTVTSHCIGAKVFDSEAERIEARRRPRIWTDLSLLSTLEKKERKREWRRLYYKNKYNTQLNYRVALNLRMSLRSALRKQKVQRLSSKDYGIDYEEICKHLGNKPVGDYHIDHIVPCSAFDFTDISQISKCFHYSNLRWCEAKENLRKNNRWTDENGVKYKGRQQIKVL